MCGFDVTVAAVMVTCWVVRVLTATSSSSNWLPRNYTIRASPRPTAPRPPCSRPAHAPQPRRARVIHALIAVGFCRSTVPTCLHKTTYKLTPFSHNTSYLNRWSKWQFNSFLQQDYKGMWSATRRSDGECFLKQRATTTNYAAPCNQWGDAHLSLSLHKT